MSELEQARKEAAQAKTEFEDHTRKACIAIGRYVQAMEKAQALTSGVTIGELGVPPDLQNKLRELLITEHPHKQLLREGFECFMGWGWNKSYEVIPMVKKGESQ